MLKVWAKEEEGGKSKVISSNQAEVSIAVSEQLRPDDLDI